jgi:plasmid stabilization system protein ParE
VRLRLADAAIAEIGAIGEFIGKDNPARAASFVQELLDMCADLVNAPEAFPIAERYPGKNVRRRVYGSYLIFYRVGDGVVDVLHVTHGARNYERWGEDR